MLQQIQEGNKVCRLNKALYGLQQTGRAWYSKLNKVLLEMEAVQSKNDPCLYRIGRGKVPALILTYVDDILVSSPNATVEEITRQLSKRFEIKNLDVVSFCLDIEIEKHSDGYFINQRRYILELLERFGLLEATSVSSPIAVGTLLRKRSPSRKGCNYRSENWSAS